MTITFGLLCAAMLSVWIPHFGGAGKFSFFKIWHLLLGAACVSGLATGYVTWIGVVGVLVFAILAYDAEHMSSVLTRRIAFGLTICLGLAFAMHKYPGFLNPKLFDAIKLSPDSAPLTVYLNFDKAVVGIVLAGSLCSRIVSFRALFAALKGALLPAAVTLIAVFGVGLATGYIHIDFKEPARIVSFAIVNLIFACVAEEAFFRGVLQERMQRAMVSMKYGAFAAVLISSALFALAHVGGGPRLVGFAFLAGLGYGAVYARTKSLEAAIFTHLLLNTLHFAVFSYPYAI